MEKTESEITYRMSVCDCEHEGDIEETKEEIWQAGGKAVDSYWDGNDCGEAYVDFIIREGFDRVTVLKKLGLTRNN